MAERILLIGMNNPLSAKPEHALFPDPVGCTGWRLWQMLQARTGATQADYLRAFGRTNLVRGRWDAKLARSNWEAMSEELREEYDVIILLGAAVRRAVGFRGGDLPDVGLRGDIGTIPHPSGLNRWYNTPLNKTAVELLLEELYVRAIA